MKGLSKTTWQVIQKLFPPENHEEAGQILVSECGTNLPFLSFFSKNKYGLERIRFAVLKISRGDMDRLRSAVKLAQSDWRDALMAAGFEVSAKAHKEWAEQTRKAS